MSQSRGAEPPLQPKPKGDTEGSSNSPTPDERQAELERSNGGEWTVDEEGIVNEPSDRSGPDFDADLDPSDAP